uniref:XLR/SYCP3/FAM9 domain-containing protein n=1 Tax=Ornithorhynchus anatinus TaxID=9258 RepID=K7EEA4_ORNAN
MTTNGENLPVSSDDTVMEEQDAGAFQQEENKDLSGFQEDAEEGQTSVADETETKNPGESELSADYWGDEIQSFLDGLEGDISKDLLDLMKKVELYVKASLPVSGLEIEQGGKTQQELRDEIKRYYSQEFLKIFQQCNETVQIFEELYNSVTEPFYQQNGFQPSSLDEEILEAFRQRYDQFTKAIEEMKRENEVILMNAQNDLEKILELHSKPLLEKKLQQQIAIFYKLLKSMVF